MASSSYVNGVPLASDGEIPLPPNAPVQHGEVRPSAINGELHVNSDHFHRRPRFDHHEIPLNPEYAYTPRKIRVFTIGAGFSGYVCQL